MAHQNDRPAVLSALPVQQQISVCLRLFKTCENVRKQFLQDRMKMPELLRIGLIRIRDRVALQHFRQLPRIKQGTFLILCRIVIRLFSRTEQQHM